MPHHIPAENELDRLGNEIAELAACIDAATHRLLTLIAEFDRRSGWNDGGCRSCAHWLSWRIGLDLGAAREKVRVARALEGLPRVSEAFRRGEISYSKVRAITRVAKPESEEQLLRVARNGTAAQVERIVRGWRRVDAAEAGQARRQHEGRYLQMHTDEDGMLVIRGRLSPEHGAAFRRAIEAAEDKIFEDDANVPAETSLPQRRADALGLVAESALSSGLDSGHRGDRYQVVVHVDGSVLADPRSPGQSVLEDGSSVPVETSRRLACDAARVVMQHDGEGNVLDVGRKTRIVPAALRRALEQRDRTCRFPGCSSKWCDSHHVQHWANGGETKLGNLSLLCRFHHSAVHEGGYRIEVRADGELAFYRPNGRLVVDAPARAFWGDDPVVGLREQCPEVMDDIDAWTSAPLDYTERLDLDWAMLVLRQGPPSVYRF